MKINKISVNQCSFRRNLNNDRNNNQTENESKKPSGLLGAALAGLAALGKIVAKPQKTSIEEIEFISNGDGKKLAYKDGKVFSGTVEIVKKDKITQIEFLNGTLKKSVQKSPDGKLIFGMEYKYLDNGTLVVEKFYQTSDLKPITETAVITKKSYHLNRDDYTGYNPIVELANWRKDENGKVVAEKLSADGKKVNIATFEPTEESPIITRDERDYETYLYKIPGNNVPIQTLDKLD